MNQDIEQLHPYPFEKLQALFQGLKPDTSLSPIALSIGEPKHPSPQFVKDIVINEVHRLANYPSTKGLPELRSSIALWLEKRFSLQNGIDPETQVLPVNGTREALFAFAQAVVDRSKSATVLMPNPFYQIYEGAAILAGAAPVYLDCEPENGWIPDFEAITPAQWKQCQLLYLCTPGNPSGAVIPNNTLERLINLAQQYNFIIASDECYSEIYCDETKPPIGLLQVCAAMGNHAFKHCLAFHSLSKRSNLPGLRSGFVAGDASIVNQFLKYRTYHGCAMPIHHQLASIAAWGDEKHVAHNRELYRQKFTAALDIFDGKLTVSKPDAGFYLWAETPIPDPLFAKRLFEEQHVTVLPGQYLGRSVNGRNPGENRVRMALVAPVTDCIEACERIKNLCSSL